LAFGDVVTCGKECEYYVLLLRAGSPYVFIWTITALIKNSFLKENEFEKGRMIAVFGQEIIGSLAYTIYGFFLVQCS